MKKPVASIQASPRAVSWLLVGAATLVVLVTFQDYGITWDEGVQAAYGELSLSYFTSGFSDTTCNTFLDLHLYGPLVEMVPALLYRGDGEMRYEVRHLFLGLLAVLTLPGILLYGRRLGIGGLAALALVMQPRFYGHWFNNSKDVPFALGVIWFFVAVAALLLEPRSTWKRAIACGAALGLALCVRPGGLPLLAAFLVVAALLFWITRMPDDRRRSARRLLWIPAVVVLGWVLMVLPWPWAHASPLAHPIEAMRQAMSFGKSYPVLFEGQVMPSDQLPSYYLIKFLLIATPLPILLLAGFGLVRAVRESIRQPRGDRTFLHLLTLAWLLLPVAGFVLFEPNVYDGVRHFLFVLPALAVFAGLGATSLIAIAGRLSTARQAPAAAWAVGVALLLLPARELVRLHPYQMTFYNGLVGGVHGAATHYQTDYWISSYREGMLWINAQARREPDRAYRVLVSGTTYVLPAADHYRAPNIEVVTLEQFLRAKMSLSQFDYCLATTRVPWSRAMIGCGQVVHTVGREGATFAEIRRTSPSARHARIGT